MIKSIFICFGKSCRRICCGKKKKDVAVQQDVPNLPLKNKQTQTKPLTLAHRDAEILYRKNSKVSLSAWSGDIELIKGANVEELNKKFSFKGSKALLLDKMVHDYSKHVSLTGLKEKSKFEINKLTKEQVETMLEDYERKLKKDKFLSENKFARYRNTIEDIKDSSLSGINKRNGKKYDNVVSRSQLEKLLDQYRINRAKKQSFSALTKVKWLPI